MHLALLSPSSLSAARVQELAYFLSRTLDSCDTPRVKSSGWTSEFEPQNWSRTDSSSTEDSVEICNIPSPLNVTGRCLSHIVPQLFRISAYPLAQDMTQREGGGCVALGRLVACHTHNRDNNLIRQVGLSQSHA